ncbi:unnamed protein product [Urochloa decumbens]|uniref:Uncharacterized protein n=1 Tax=Urochloa decumbens TaxID=240449 RepID=A0ABC9AS00_9POAL
MEIVAGALPSLLPKLAALIVGEYNLQMEVKKGIIFLQEELKSMQGALQKISKTPSDEIDDQDKIWARNVREMSYDIEDNIDKFILQCKAKQHVCKTIIDRSLELLKQPKIYHNIAIDIRDIKTRVKEVAKRRKRYKITSKIAKTVTIDPRLLVQYEMEIELVGIDEAREEVIKILVEGDEVFKQKDQIVSIVGFGGLGKTTLANAVYENLREQFNCWAFVTVSRTPDLVKVLMDMLTALGKNNIIASNSDIILIKQLREFLKNKRYPIVIDDIWDISDWKAIKCALPDSNVGNKIITTTRNFSVGEQAGHVYKLAPLSSSMLTAGKMEWYNVYQSIGTGLEKSQAFETMRKILSLSYSDLPCHLQSCLLYFSLFPEDYKICKTRLIWMWIAEGFVKSKDQSKSLFEHGESYFNELINRSMIQLIYNLYNGSVEQCHVHDMVLDLLCYISIEENFVTILNNGKFPSNKSRWLSLQNGKEDVVTEATTILEQVRSVVVFPFGVDLMPSIGRFRVLRVLDLQYCSLSKGHSLRYLCNLFYLRYLGLRCTGIAQLPEEIGKMQNLQTLNVMENQISSLPSTVVQLRNLMCLLTDKWTRMPNGIGKLACLQQLSKLCIDKSTVDTAVDDLGKLTELQVLHVVLPKWNEKLVNCLHKLQKIQDLHIEVLSGQRITGGLDDWVAPRQICELNTRRSCWFSRLPPWMNPLRVVNLSVLSISMTELQPEHLEMLGRLPALRYLELELDHDNVGGHRSFVFGSGLFPCLVHGEFSRFVWPVVFQRGVMPRLRELSFSHSYVRMAKEMGSSRLGLGNLLSLRRIAIDFVSECASKEEAKKAKAALRLAKQMHPNRPNLFL